MALMAGPVLVVSLDAPQILLDQRAAGEPPRLHGSVDAGDGRFVHLEWRGRCAARLGDTCAQDSSQADPTQHLRNLTAVSLIP